MNIYMRQLLPSTFLALRDLCVERGWSDVFDYMEPAEVALMTYRLKYVTDNADSFPHGKWATIQRLQNMVEEWAEGEAKELKDPK